MFQLKLLQGDITIQHVTFVNKQAAVNTATAVDLLQCGNFPSRYNATPILLAFCIAAGIALWLGYGPSMGFKDDWQLDVNTATAVELMLMTTFLQNTKRRHRLYMHRCISLISLIDDETEARLDAAALENQASQLYPLPPPPPPSWALPPSPN